MFNLTPSAAQQIARSAAQSGAEHMALRVAARSEPDGSLQYGMGFDDVRENDMNLEIEGVAVVIAEPHQALLDGTTLDYVELEPGQFRFIFVPDGPAQPADEAQGGCGNGVCVSGGCGSPRR